MYKIQDDHLQIDKGGHSSRSVGSLTQHQVSILPHSNSKETSLLPLLQVERQSLQIQDFAFSLCTAPNTFRRVTKPILLLCWKMAKTIFLYLHDALILANSYTVSKQDGQRVVQLLQRLSLEKCQLESTQEFTHLSLVFNTQNMSLSFAQDKVLTIKAQAGKVAFSPTCIVAMRLLDLTNFDSMALPLARLHSNPVQF